MMIIIKYPPSHTISYEKIKLAKEGDIIVLLQDGVLYALDEGLIKDPVSYTHLTLPTKRIV